jgi:hypothetical protein
VAWIAVDVAAASALTTLVYLLAWKRNLFRAEPTEEELHGNLVGGLVPAAVFLVSIPIAYLASPLAAELSWLSLLVLKPLTRHRRHSGPKREAG